MRHTPRAGAHLHARARPGVPPRMRPFWKVVYLPGMHARVERASAARGGALKMPACTNLCAVCPCPTRSAPSVRPAGLSAHPCAQASQVLFRAPGCAPLRAGERGAFPRAGRTRARRPRRAARSLGNRRRRCHPGASGATTTTAAGRPRRAARNLDNGALHPAWCFPPHLFVLPQATFKCMLLIHRPTNAYPTTPHDRGAGPCRPPLTLCVHTYPQGVHALENFCLHHGLPDLGRSTVTQRRDHSLDMRTRESARQLGGGPTTRTRKAFGGHYVPPQEGRSGILISSEICPRDRSAIPLGLRPPPWKYAPACPRFISCVCVAFDMLKVLGFNVRHCDPHI